MVMEGATPSDDPAIEDVAAGQRMIIYAILVNVMALVLRNQFGNIWALLGIGSVVLAIVGLLRLADGLQYSSGRKTLLIVCAFIPVVSLVMLALVNARATATLRMAGYKVGLLGARKP